MRFEFLAATALAVTVAVPAFAEGGTSAPDETAQSDDIIVTATKRERTLGDVPLSVSVTTPETIQRAQIIDVIDLQTVVPSLMVQQFNAIGQTNFYIRGFGNGNGNDGIEGSVGLFIDGVYRTRTSAGMDDLPEIERIEVLRGPQSTLFGKNVSAGAISIVTKKPQFAWGGKAELTAGNYGLMRASATLTGPISSTLALRLSGTINQRDGTFTDTLTGQDINNRNRYSVRGDLLWQPNADLSVRILADYTRIKERCCGVTSLQNGPATQFIGAPAPFGLGKAISDPANPFSYKVAFNTDPSNRLVGKGVSGQIDYNLGFASLTSITAYRNQVNQSQQDVDFTGADIVTNTTANDISTFTQEVRLASKDGGRLNWLLGAFYQDESVDTGRDIRFGRETRAFADGVSGGAIGQLETLQSLVNPGVIPGRTYFQPGQGLSDRYKLSQRSFSIFGEVDFKVTDRLTLTAGAAYLNDHKRAQSFVVMNEPFSALNLQNVPELGFLPLAILNPLAPPGATIPTNLFAPLSQLQFFYANSPVHGPVNFPNATESGVLDGDKVTYSLRAAYDFGPVNVYFSYATGWKAAAFNLSSDGRPPDGNGVGRSAAPENVTVYEAGIKAQFRGGYLNLAVFKQSIMGFQSNIFTGYGYSLLNAGEESVKGFEVDGAYAPVKMLSLTAAATYLAPRYDSFKGASCVNYDLVRCPINPVTGLRPNFRDLTGDLPAGIPEWRVSVSATANHDIAPGVNAYLRGEYDYTSPNHLSESTPPGIGTWGANVVNASVGVSFERVKLDLMLWARNLTNDNSMISTFPTVAQDGSYTGYPTQPRTFGATIRKSF
ncbi:TonB-dependent receptor [Sphingomonas immobilis]|uniref:TonB-dependent receptor n=1 Tax=Sphingomonas immobilis TaxID=3063997 RepID=A0ABT8ZUF5_9SPHN|nr:TonB-dependent receptor [Sphingomonas sp. CA1-15]MDO7841213.1 TonB-dependent receptor [Sphingomonas sp. CA1-15]